MTQKIAWKLVQIPFLVILQLNTSTLGGKGPRRNPPCSTPHEPSFFWHPHLSSASLFSPPPLRSTTAPKPPRKSPPRPRVRRRRTLAGRCLWRHTGASRRLAGLDLVPITN